MVKLKKMKAYFKKVVLVSGGSDGLGKTIAGYLKSDCEVVIISPTKEKLQKVANELNVDYLIGDVGNINSLKNVVKNSVLKYKRIDALINCAGLWLEGELDNNSYEDIRKLVEVNTLGTIYLCKAVIPQMKKQRSGLIINIISQAGIYHKAERTVYNASKWAITGFTKSLQPEVAKYGISVSGIYPGKMKTEMFKKMGIEKDMNDALDPIEVARTVKFLLETDTNVNFPEIGIKNINN